MKRLLLFETFIFENEPMTQDVIWYDAIKYNHVETAKELLANGYDVNSLLSTGRPALFYVFRENRHPLIFLLFEQPNIDITFKNDDNETVLEYYYLNYNQRMFKEICGFLKNYNFQKKIIKNNRLDIISYFNKFGLVHPKILAEYPSIVTASDLDLL